MREFATSSQLSANEQRTLATVMGQVEGAATRLATAQGRAQDSFQAEQLVRYNGALLDLKRSLEAGTISQEQFSASARDLATSIERSRAQVEQGGRAYVGYTQALTRVDSSLAQAEGRVRTFGVASGVTAGIGDQLQNVLYRLGPAGEAMGVAMFSAGAGMTGAATGAKLLNIALAVGLVGAIISAAVGAVALAKNMFALDTGLTDVAKTTGFTQTELRGLAGELQQIALNTGTPGKKLLDLASVAGSLGVTGVKNVAQFTDVMNKLAIATDIVGEEGAQQLAKFINVTKDAGQSVGDAAELVGNVIVRLGNSLATTEAPILAMAQRLAGLKTAAGVSQPDILGLAGAFVSLGISAELGGTNVVKIFTNMSLAASQGGQELRDFAAVAGMTTEQFKTLVKENPADAFIALVEGLKRAKDAGQDINPALQAIVGNNTEMRRVVLAAVGGFDTFTLAMSGARDEAERMTAMNKELQTRLESLSGITSQIGQVFRYAFDSLALSAIPALKGALTGILDFSRGVLGLEQTGDRVESFATRSGSAIGQFASALLTGKNETDTFAAGVGAGFGQAYDIISSTSELIKTSILTVFGGALTAGADAVMAFVGNIAQSFGGGTAVVGTIFNALGVVVSNTVQFIGSTLGRIPVYYQALQAASGELSSSVSRIFTSMGDVLLGFGYIVYGGIVQPFVDMLAPIRAAAGNVLISVGNFVQAAADRFKPFLDFLTKIGIGVGEFITSSTENAIGKVTELLNRGVVEHKGAGAAFTGTNESIATGFDLIGRGVSGAANAVGDGTNAMTRALRDTDTQLGASADAGTELAAANTELGNTATAAATEVTDLGTSTDGAATGVTELGSVTETAAVSISTMTERAIALSEVRFGDFGVAFTVQAIQQSYGAFTSYQDALDKTYQAGVVTAEVLEYLAANFATTGRDADTYSTNLSNLAAMGAAAAREQGVLDAVLGQLSLNIVTEETNRLASAQQLAADNATRATDSWRTLKETQDGYTTSTRLTVEQTNTLATVMSSTRTALQEAENAFTITGNAAQFNADKTEIYRGALETLYRAGIDPATVGLEGWVQALGESEAKTEAQVAATKRLEEGAKSYTENLTTLRDVQEQLADTSDLTAQQAMEMYNSLEKASQGAGQLAVEARAARQELLEFAAAKAVLEQTTKQLELVGLALTGLSNFVASQGANNNFVALLSGLGAAATEAAGQIENFSGSAQDQLTAAGAVVGVFAGAVRTAFGDEIPDAVDIGLTALETGIQGAAAGFAVGGPLGAAIGGGLGLIAGFFTAASDAANAAAAEEEQRQKEAAEAHAQYIEDWKKREAERIESIREGQRELARLYDEMRQSSADLTRDLNDARLENARASGADEAVIFISETILALRAASADFGAEMQKLTQDKEQFILAYLQAHPGSTRAEANQAAEAIFGPQRDALREQLVLTSETILLEAEQTAKDLGLSQKEFYEAVFAGNTELLGTMTEGQRQAIIQFVEMARSMGIELPAALNEAYDNINGANESGGNSVVESLEAQRNVLKSSFDTLKSDWKERSAELREEIKNAKGEDKAELERLFQEEKGDYERRAGELSEGIRNYNEQIAQAERDGTATRSSAAQENLESLRQEKDEFKTAWEERSSELKELIANSSGETRAAYIGMFVQEQEDYRAGLQIRNEAINAANQESANSDVEGLKSRLEVVVEALKTATGAQRDALLSEKDELIAAIRENSDGLNSELASNAQGTIDTIQSDLGALNEAWATRSAELIRLIDSSTGVTKEAYQRQYQTESEAYRTNRQMLQDDLTAANRSLLDAQDASADDFVAAQAEVGRREQEALNGVFAILRQVLGEDANAIIGLIQNTYNGRRAAYLAEGQATAEAAGRANQGEIDKLNEVFTILRQVLGDDANAIIGMIQTSYDKRSGAYQTGGEGAARAAELAAESERQSLANINQLLRDLFGPEAEGIISMILALGEKKRKAHIDAGAAAGEGASIGSENERQTIANLNQLLRDIFGPEADGIINQILALGERKRKAHIDAGEATGQGAVEGGNKAAAGTTDGADTEAGALEQGETKVVGAADKRFTNTEKAISDGYDKVLTTQGSSSAGFVKTVETSYGAEQARFESESATMERLIATSKGAEREALIKEYDAMKREHQAKSVDVQGQYTTAGTKEATALKGAFEDVGAGAVAGGKVAVQGTNTAYGDVTDATKKESGIFSGVLGGTTTTLEEKQRLLFDKQKDMMIARRNVLRSVTRESYLLLSRENEGFARDMLAPAIGRAATKVTDAIIAMHEKIRGTIERQTALTRTAIRTQNTVLSSASTGGTGASGDMGDFSSSTEMSFPEPVQAAMTSFARPYIGPAIGSFAADGFPDFAAATGQAYAYAAATSSLIDLFGPNRTLAFTGSQERLFSFTFSFSDLGGIMAGPMALLEKAANTFAESVRYDRETALFQRETALLEREKRVSTYDLARGKKRGG